MISALSGFTFAFDVSIFKFTEKKSILVCHCKKGA